MRVCRAGTPQQRGGHPPALTPRPSPVCRSIPLYRSLSKKGSATHGAPEPLALRGGMWLLESTQGASQIHNAKAPSPVQAL